MAASAAASAASGIYTMACKSNYSGPLLYEVPKMVHDTLVGSCDLQERTYEQFFKDAEIIAKSAGITGAKLDWIPGKKPSFNPPHYLFRFLPLQGAIRFCEDNFLPGFVANANKCSQNALDWSKALLSKPHQINEHDKAIFELAKSAFEQQAMIYQRESESVAEHNYNIAAMNLTRFLHASEINSYGDSLRRSQSFVDSLSGRASSLVGIKGPTGTTLTRAQIQQLRMQHDLYECLMLSKEPWFPILSRLNLSSSGARQCLTAGESGLLALMPPDSVSAGSSSGASGARVEEVNELNSSSSSTGTAGAGVSASAGLASTGAAAVVVQEEDDGFVLVKKD